MRWCSMVSRTYLQTLQVYVQIRLSLTNSSFQPSTPNSAAFKFNQRLFSPKQIKLILKLNKHAE